jgi:oxygen-independent coproporphyrinogen-3 oxidase
VFLLNRIQSEFGQGYYDYLIKQSQRIVNDDLLSITNNVFTTTKKKESLTDG